MKRVMNPLVLFDYEVVGAREEEAAAKLESTLDFYSRDYHSSYAAMDISEIREKIAADFGVEIKTTL